MTFSVLRNYGAAMLFSDYTSVKYGGLRVLNFYTVGKCWQQSDISVYFRYAETTNGARIILLL
jgi:hypothetical protein